VISANEQHLFEGKKYTIKAFFFTKTLKNYLKVSRFYQTITIIVLSKVQKIVKVSFCLD